MWKLIRWLKDWFEYRREYRRILAALERVERDPLDGLLDDYAIENLDWPESPKELDRFLLSDSASCKSRLRSEN